MLANNYRMTNITAAIGLAQLENIDIVLKRKAEIASLYRNAFKGSPLEFHNQDHNIIHSYWMCSILVDNAHQRDPLRDFLLQQGIETRPLFYPAHTLPFYASYIQGDYRIASDLSARGINLPSYPALTDEDVLFIASKVLKFADSSK
jgi:perosamine synthetase